MLLACAEFQHNEMHYNHVLLHVLNSTYLNIVYIRTRFAHESHLEITTWECKDMYYSGGPMTIFMYTQVVWLS